MQSDKNQNFLSSQYAKCDHDLNIQIGNILIHSATTSDDNITTSMRTILSLHFKPYLKVQHNI